MLRICPEEDPLVQLVILVKYPLEISFNLRVFRKARTLLNNLDKLSLKNGFLFLKQSDLSLNLCHPFSALRQDDLHIGARIVALATLDAFKCVPISSLDHGFHSKFCRDHVFDKLVEHRVPLSLRIKVQASLYVFDTVCAIRAVFVN